MPIGQLLGSIGKRLIPTLAPTSIRTPPFIGDDYGDQNNAPDDQEDDGSDQNQPAPPPPASPPASPASAVGNVGGPPKALPTPPPAPPQPPTFRPDLDPDTQKYLDIARQGAPMAPTHGTLRTIGESLGSRFLGKELATEVFDPAYAKASKRYQQQLQNAQIPAAIRGKAESQTATTSNTMAEGALKGKQAANYDTNAQLGAIEHGGELVPDNQTPPPEGTSPAPPREGSTMTVGGKPVFFPSKQQQRIESEQAKKTDWLAVTPDMAESLSDLGVKAGDKVPPTVFNQYQRIIQTQNKTPKLTFEHFTNQRTGDVTTIGFDPATGEPVKRHVEKGIAEVKLPSTNTQQNFDTSRSDKSYQYSDGQLQKVSQPVDQMISRMGRLQDTIRQATPQADALVAPELLTVMAGGPGSGLRMNEAEISRIVGGRTNLESLKAALNKWQIDPTKGLSITPAQRLQIVSLVNEVNTKLVAKQKIITEAQDALLDSDDPKDHRRIVANARQALAKIDQSSGTTQKITIHASDGKDHVFDTEQQAQAFEAAVKAARGTTQRK